MFPKIISNLYISYMAYKQSIWTYPWKTYFGNIYSPGWVVSTTSWYINIIHTHIQFALLLMFTWHSVWTQISSVEGCLQNIVNSCFFLSSHPVTSQLMIDVFISKKIKITQVIFFFSGLHHVWWLWIEQQFEDEKLCIFRHFMGWK